VREAARLGGAGVSPTGVPGGPTTVVIAVDAGGADGGAITVGGLDEVRGGVAVGLDALAGDSTVAVRVTAGVEAGVRPVGGSALQALGAENATASTAPKAATRLRLGHCIWQSPQGQSDWELAVPRLIRLCWGWPPLSRSGGHSDWAFGTRYCGGYWRLYG
jgi:hypothetical protein